MYFDLIEAAKDTPRWPLAFRLYQLWIRTGKRKYLLGAFRYTIPIASICLQKLHLQQQDWEDALSMIASELFTLLKRKYWKRIYRPANYYLAVMQVVSCLKENAFREIKGKPFPAHFSLSPGVTHGSAGHPASVLADIYLEEVVEYVKRRAPEMVRCRRREREVVPVVMDHILRGVPLRMKDHGDGRVSVGVRLNGSVKPQRVRLLIDRISICCRRAMYELEEEDTRYDGLSVKGVLQGTLRRTWQPLSLS